MELLAPSVEEWKRLFELVEKFKNLESWYWMGYGDVFGVQDPNTGTICYFNVIAFEMEDSEVYGLAVYIGKDGLSSLLEMLDEVHDDEEQFFYNDLIIIQFVDRKILTKEDLEIIKKVGLKFRGKNNWILFRRCIPGYIPRMLNKEEVNLLNSVLDQAIDVCLMFKENPNLKSMDKVLIRTCKKEDSKVIWEDEQVSLDYPDEELIVYDTNEIIEKGINEIKPKKTLDEWAIDFFFLPNPVQDEESGDIYFPYLGIVMNNIMKTGINLEMFKYSRENRLIYPQELFINTVSMTQSLPRSIVVKNDSIYNALLDITQPLGIELRIMDRIDIIEDFKNSVRESASEE
ncbi:MAG: DUF7309 domain-containing protein [bacterium]